MTGALPPKKLYAKGQIFGPRRTGVLDIRKVASVNYGCFVCLEGLEFVQYLSVFLIKNVTYSVSRYYIEFHKNNTKNRFTL